MRYFYAGYLGSFTALLSHLLDLGKRCSQESGIDTY